MLKKGMLLTITFLILLQNQSFSQDYKKSIRNQEKQGEFTTLLSQNSNITRYNGKCRALFAQGFEVEYKIAKQIMEQLSVQETSIISEMVVIIQRYPEGFYSHSNYITPKADYPVKICGPLNNLKKILANILFNKPPEGVELGKLDNAYLNEVTFVFYENVFLRSEPLLKLGNLTNFSIYDYHGNIISVNKENFNDDKVKYSLNLIVDSDKSKDCVDSPFSDFGTLIDTTIGVLSCGIDYFKE